MKLCIACSLPTETDPCHLCGESQNVKNHITLAAKFLAASPRVKMYGRHYTYRGGAGGYESVGILKERADGSRNVVTSLGSKCYADEIPFRSCWECNPSHEHLRDVARMFWCFECGKIYVLGVEVDVASIICASSSNRCHTYQLHQSADQKESIIYMSNLCIYVASSWRNNVQPSVVELLRSLDHSVYDFRNPNFNYDPKSKPDKGFSWAEIDPNWQDWTNDEYRRALQHPIAQRGYRNDINALELADVCVLVLPSGRSASWELGYAMGRGTPGIVLQLNKVEPELMYREARIVTLFEELKALFALGGAFGCDSAFCEEMNARKAATSRAPRGVK